MIRLPLGRTSAALACLLATATAAHARPYAPQLSCGALNDIVASEGAAVIGTSRRAYDRFVHSSQFCERSEITEPAWVQAADDRECFIGYTCKENDRGEEQ